MASRKTRELLVHVGGMNAHKNILGLLKAMPQIIAAEPKTHLALVGDTSGKGFWDNVDELKAFVAATPRFRPMFISPATSAIPTWPSF